MSRWKTLLPVILAAIASAWFALAPAAAADPDTVKFGSVGGITDAGLYIADDLGFFKEAGIKVEMQVVSTAPALAAAVATSQLDVGGIAVTPALFASVEQGIELRIVGDKQSMRPGFSATRMIVLPALSKATEDATMHGLKGKTIALSSRESITGYFLWRILTKHEMSLSDVKIAELSYPTMAAALASGAVDGAISIEPFLSKALIAGDAKELSDLTEFGPSAGMTTVAIVYSEKFRKERAAAQKFMTAYMRGVRVYNDAFVKNKGRDKVIDIIARHARIDRDIIKNSFPIGLSPDQRVDVAALKAVEDFYLAQHMLAAPIDPQRIVDMSFADAAVKTLGPYQ
jgi:NitT/TauT family transport system substrate-binding protein